MHEYLKYVLFKKKEEKQNNKFSTLFVVTSVLLFSLAISFSQPSQMHISLHTKLFFLQLHRNVLHPLLHLQYKGTIQLSIPAPAAVALS